MDIKTEKICLEKLQELVEDEDKIVTLPFLAKHLDLTVENASKILKKFVNNQRESDSHKFSLTYILTGTCDGNRNCVFMVKENDLNDKKMCLSEVTSEVLYSIQKSKNLDFNVTAIVDWNEENGKTLPGTVVSKNCIKRKLKVKKLPPPPAPVLKGKSSYFIPKTELKPAEKTEEKPKSTAGVANLFNKAPSIKTDNNNKDSKTKTNTKPKNSLTSFLSKTTSKTISLTSSDSNKSETTNFKSNSGTFTSETSNGTSSAKEECEDVEMKEALNDFIEDLTEEQEPKKESKLDETVKKRKESKRKRNSSVEKDKKRRKRIIELHDSESDDMFENEDDIIEPSEHERSPSPVAVKQLLAPKNKRMKAVLKTYMDEEEYLVTKTEYIYETPSEEENEEPSKPEAKKVEEPPKKGTVVTKKDSNSSQSTSPQKGKGKKGKKVNMQNQPTLMNFFKRK